MPKLDIRFNSIPGEIPTVHDLRDYKFGHNLSDGKGYAIRIVDGVETVVCIWGPIETTQTIKHDYLTAEKFDNIRIYEPVYELVHNRKKKAVACYLSSGDLYVPWPINYNGISDPFNSVNIEAGDSESCDVILIFTGLNELDQNIFYENTIISADYEIEVTELENIIEHNKNLQVGFALLIEGSNVYPIQFETIDYNNTKIYISDTGTFTVRLFFYIPSRLYNSEIVGFEVYSVPLSGVVTATRPILAAFVKTSNNEFLSMSYSNSGTNEITIDIGDLTNVTAYVLCSGTANNPNQMISFKAMANVWLIEGSKIITHGTGLAPIGCTIRKGNETFPWTLLYNPNYDYLQKVGVPNSEPMLTDVNFFLLKADVTSQGNKPLTVHSFVNETESDIIVHNLNLDCGMVMIKIGMDWFPSSFTQIDKNQILVDTSVDHEVLLFMINELPFDRLDQSIVASYKSVSVYSEGALVHNANKPAVGLFIETTELQHLIYSFENRLDQLQKTYSNIDAFKSGVLVFKGVLPSVIGVNPKRLLGRYDTTIGPQQEIRVGSNLELTDSGVLNATGGGGLNIPILQVKGFNHKPASEQYQVRDLLKMRWSSLDTAFLNYNPEIWVFRHNSYRRRRILPDNSIDYYAINKGWKHESHLNGVKFPGSNFYSGEFYSLLPITDLQAQGRHTEFELTAGCNEWQTVDLPQWEYFYLIDGGDYRMPNDTDDYTNAGLVMDMISRKQYIVFRFAIVIDNPDPTAANPKIIGPLSDGIKMNKQYLHNYPDVGQGMWRFKYANFDHFVRKIN